MTGSLVDLQGRVRDRARERRRRRLRRAVLVAVLVVALAGVGWVLWASPLFSVKKVVVTGNRLVASDAAISAAGVSLGTPLGLVDAAAVGRRLSELPAVARGEASVVLPDTLALRITERTPAVVVKADGGFSWVDPGGVVFHSSPERPKGVPLAQANVQDAALLREVTAVVAAVPARLAATVTEVRAESRDAIVLVTRTGRIVWGSAEDSTMKGRLADTLLQAQPRCRVVNVSAPTQPVTRC